MEVLGVHVMHDIWLLVELVAIHILDAKSYIIIKIKISTIGEKHDGKSNETWAHFSRFETTCLLPAKMRKHLVILAEDLARWTQTRKKLTFQTRVDLELYAKTYLPLLPSRHGTCK